MRKTHRVAIDRQPGRDGPSVVHDIICTLG